MMSHTHGKLSTQLVHDIKKHYNIQLEESMLSWGSKKPDLAIPPFRPKHYMKESLDLVINWIKKLIEQPIITMPELSLKIGVITHFLADFFTLPHSERWDFILSGKIVDHIKYEKKLKDIAKDDVKEIPIEYMKTESLKNLDDIKTCILNWHKEYQNKTDYKRDLKFAYTICFIVTSWILLKLKLIPQLSLAS